MGISSHHHREEEAAAKKFRTAITPDDTSLDHNLPAMPYTVFI